MNKWGKRIDMLLPLIFVAGNLAVLLWVIYFFLPLLAEAIKSI